ncbi:WD repeat protein [Paecilomyces variotii]|uniref:WD repeat protein n=1 Tax=Byssochlamys spectabilis TaxID=264951 RepID=A0A443HIX2_BYSSP|nr:WD repeat protein [Paecilomyces variotii]RWQ91792.1 WD repeat protein [Paecilomyces variotii]
MSTLLHSREIGGRVNHRIQSRTSLDFTHVKSWKGASNDVIVLAWSEDGTRFAVGAAAQCDEHNMQYNRGNNLILGDLVSNSLKALPDHRIPRPLPASAASQHVYNTVDPHLYMSVTAVQWYGDTLFTASYDNTVKLWDVSSHAAARCVKTLHHNSKVQVMARSNFSPNLLATGAQAFGVWNIESRTYMPLDVVRRNPTKNLELIPSSLAWGTSEASKHFLVGGMSGRDTENGDTSREGHMAVWRVNEASISSDQLLPNAQNVFDVTWHPRLPLFATGSAAPLLRSATTAKDTRSVVRVYDPLQGKRCAVEFDCPALDINDVEFCPLDPNYMTASCTDGVTYVWDNRNPSEILHRLQHGEPLNQLDENLTREQADVGVRVALWGDHVQRFYTGGSDGRLKVWDILRSPEDAHVQDVVTLEEEIMCASFSGDKTNILIGDAAGGVHVLSSAPFEHSSCMKFEHAGEPFDDMEEQEESAVKMADRLLSSGQLVRHPVYGVGQGPLYNGPYAAWARPAHTPTDLLGITPLTEDVQALQLDGPPVERRRQLDVRSRQYVAAQIRLARIRNERRSLHKRKRDTSWPAKVTLAPENLIDLCSDEDEEALAHRPRPRKAKDRTIEPIITQIVDVIDLTGDTDSEDIAVGSSEPMDTSEVVGEEDERLEALEEDYWWPDSGAVDANIQDLDD